MSEQEERLSEKSMDEMFFDEGYIECEIGRKGNEETFKIQPLVRAQYKQVIALAGNVALAFDEKILDDLIGNVGVIINVVSDEVLLKLYSIVLDKDEEWINNNILLNQEIELLTAIILTNDIEKLIENFTKALEVLNMKKQVQKKMKDYQRAGEEVLKKQKQK